MFVRFRQTKHRLQVSLAESRRVDGQIRQEHIGQLGSIETPLSVRGRVAFWHRLHERLGRLSNRVDPAKVLGQVHARIPMVTMDEMQALKLENAEADERFWSSLHGMHQEQAEGQRQLAATAEQAASSGQAAATEAAAKAAAAKDRAARIRKGEDVPGGLGKPLTHEAAAKAAGMSESEVTHAISVSELSEAEYELYVQETFRAMMRAEEATKRAFIRRVKARQQQQSDEGADP